MVDTLNSKKNKKLSSWTRTVDNSGPKFSKSMKKISLIKLQRSKKILNQWYVMKNKWKVYGAVKKKLDTVCISFG